MDVELSRLAAKALSSPFMDGASFDVRSHFVHAVSQAKNREALPQDMADLLTQALASIPDGKPGEHIEQEDESDEEDTGERPAVKP